MNEQRNGSGSLSRWIMGSLFGVLVLMGSGAAAAFSARLTELEHAQQIKSERQIQIESEVRGLRLDVCRLEGKVDDLIEDVTHRRQYRTPCP